MAKDANCNWSFQQVVITNHRSPKQRIMKKFKIF